MKVALNLLQLAPGRPEGAATYVRELVAQFDKLSTEDHFFVLVQPGLDLPPLRVKSPVTIIPVAAPRSLSLAGRAVRKLARKFGAANAKTLDGTLEQHQIDAVHYPFSTIPESDQALKLPVILSVMDLQHEYFPELFSTQDLANRRAAFGPSAKRADAVIAISNYTKQSLVWKIGLPEKKVSVIYLDGDLSTTPDVSLALPKEFMYYPAADWAHKNHLALFEAMKQLKDAGKPCPCLVLTGVVSDRLPKLQIAIHTSGLDDKIVHLGQVTYDQVAGIYARAKLLIYPSQFEGFGIPVLEAMRAGVPVACSNTTSVPEVAGQAAELFDPSDVSAIAQSIDRVWNDPSYARKLVIAGKQQAAKFSWSRCATETLAVYKKVSSHHGN